MMYTLIQEPTGGTLERQVPRWTDREVKTEAAYTPQGPEKTAVEHAHHVVHAAEGEAETSHELRMSLDQGLCKFWAALKGSELDFAGAQQRLVRVFCELRCHTGPVRMVYEASCGKKEGTFVVVVVVVGFFLASRTPREAFVESHFVFRSKV